MRDFFVGDNSGFIGFLLALFSLSLGRGRGAGVRF